MKQKKFETLLYSAIGIVVMLVVIVAVNLIIGAARARVDMTADKLYTLSPGTKAILKKLDSPVEVRFYFSRSENRLPSQIRTYAQQVEDLLEEFRENAKGNIELKKFDPKPDSEAEEMAQADGVEPQPTQGGENFYFGIALSLDPQKAALPYLDPNRERLLEYDLARAIGRVISTNKPIIGVMTSLPMFGTPMNPMMMRMGQQQQRPWVFISELQRDFEVKQVQMDGEKIDDSIQTLVVAHPKDISEKAQYAIDQFVLGGGKLLAFLDAMCVIDKPQQPNNPMAGMLPGGGSSLDKLLKAWGVQFDNTKVAADLAFSRELAFQQGQRPQRMPTWLFLTAEGINREDVATSQLDNLLLPAAGTFSGTPVTGLEQTVLLHTSKDSQLVDGMTAQFSGQKIVDDFKASGSTHPLAIRLKGKFKTAFPDGKPAADDKDKDKEDKADADKKKDAESSLKESKTEGVVILVGDSDFIYDNFCVRVNPMFGFAEPINGNLNLAQNFVEQLSGDVNLIGTRSRAAMNRPFTVVRDMQADAQKRYQAEIAKLEAEKGETEKQLTELQSKRDPKSQRFVLSPEQQQKIEEFRKKNAETAKRLRTVRKELRQEIESMENTLKWANILGMPLLVIGAGIGVAAVRKQRTKAR